MSCNDCNETKELEDAAVQIFAAVLNGIAASGKQMETEMRLNSSAILAQSVILADKLRQKCKSRSAESKEKTSFDLEKPQ